MPKILANTLRSRDQNGIWVDIPVVIKDDVKPTQQQIQTAVDEWFREHPEYVVVTDKTLSVADAPADSASVGDALQDIRDEIEYTPISISSFAITSVTYSGGGTGTSGTVEKGKTVTELSASFSINKVPVTLTFDGSLLTPAKTGTVTKSGSYTSNASFALVAKDNGAPNIAPATSTKNIALNFYNRVYWGSAAMPDAINDEFVLGMDYSVLTNTKSRTINGVTVASGEYMWYVLPASMGTCTFTYNGFTGGFTEVTSFNHTNASGYTESYRVYRSDNANLGLIDGLFIA